MRVGIGYDVHRLVSGRPLVIGGITIPFNKGLLGHSDADVLTHAICDALLGAAALGDIGQHFPDSDEKYKDIDSMVLLERSMKMVRGAGYAFNNLDATIFAEAPKMAPYREAMREKIAGALATTPCSVNVKATTTEGLGYVGAGEGIAAMCIVMIEAGAGPVKLNP